MSRICLLNKQEGKEDRRVDDDLDIWSLSKGNGFFWFWMIDLVWVVLNCVVCVQKFEFEFLEIQMCKIFVLKLFLEL